MSDYKIGDVVQVQDGKKQILFDAKVLSIINNKEVKIKYTTSGIVENVDKKRIKPYDLEAGRPTRPRKTPVRITLTNESLKQKVYDEEYYADKRKVMSVIGSSTRSNNTNAKKKRKKTKGQSDKPHQRVSRERKIPDYFMGKPKKINEDSTNSNSSSTSNRSSSQNDANYNDDNDNDDSDDDTFDLKESFIGSFQSQEASSCTSEKSASKRRPTDRVLRCTPERNYHEGSEEEQSNDDDKIFLSNNEIQRNIEDDFDDNDNSDDESFIKAGQRLRHPVKFRELSEMSQHILARYFKDEYKNSELKFINSKGCNVVVSEYEGIVFIQENEQNHETISIDAIKSLAEKFIYKEGWKTFTSEKQQDSIWRIMLAKSDYAINSISIDFKENYDKSHLVLAEIDKIESRDSSDNDDNDGSLKSQEANTVDSLDNADENGTTKLPILHIDVRPGNNVEGSSQSSGSETKDPSLKIDTKTNCDDITEEGDVSGLENKHNNSSDNASALLTQLPENFLDGLSDGSSP